MFRLCFWVLLVVILIQIRADDFRLAKRDKLRLCGKRLPEMLRHLCKSKYYGKRSVEYDGPNTDEYYNDVEDLEEYPNTNPNPSYPFRTRMEAFSLIPNKFRQNREQKRGIVEECCRHSCSVSELLSYCE